MYNELMTVIVDDITAFDYYARSPVNGAMADRARRIVRDGFSTTTKKAVEDFLDNMHGIDPRKLHLATANPANRPYKNKIKYRVFSDDRLLDGSYALSENLLLVPPEAALIALAPKCEPVEFIELASLLCSRFYLDQFSEYGVMPREVLLATPESITAYMDAVPGLRGSVKTRKLLPFITVNAESPMEVKVDMLTSLPKRYGGKGIPRPVLGHAVSVPEQFQRSLGSATFRYDFYWPAHNLEVEYDSDAVHGNAEKKPHDSRRRNIIQAQGVRCLTLTRDQVMHDFAFEEYIFELSSLLGVRYSTRTERNYELEQGLRAHLFNSELRDARWRSLWA